MAKSIISVMEKQGEYKDVKYHNFYIYSVDPETTNPKVLGGVEVEEFKIKADVFPGMLNRALIALGDTTRTEAKDLVGLLISPVYAKFGVLADFTLALPPKK